MNSTLIELKPCFSTGIKSFYNKAQVEILNNQINLYSYHTKVATIVYDKNRNYHIVYLVKYSATTTRHITAFLKQYGYNKILKNVSGFRNIVKILHQNGEKFEIIEGRSHKMNQTQNFIIKLYHSINNCQNLNNLNEILKQAINYDYHHQLLAKTLNDPDWVNLNAFLTDNQCTDLIDPQVLIDQICNDLDDYQDYYGENAVKRLAQLKNCNDDFVILTYDEQLAITSADENYFKYLKFKLLSALTILKNEVESRA